MDAPPGVILAGTVHLDLDASLSLYDLLEYLQPACIAVEISPFSIRYRSRMEKTWLRRLAETVQRLPASRRCHLKLELLRRQLSIPFEWSTAVKYSAERGVAAIPVDSGRISRLELPTWEEELLSEENLRFLVSLENEPVDAYFSGHYRRAERFLKQPGRIPGAWCRLVFDENRGKREGLLARRITNLSRRFRPLVYIGGWMHLINLPSRVTLASRLEQDKLLRFLVTGNGTLKI